MQINKAKFEQIVSEAKAKTNDPKWLRAIERAAAAILSGTWIVTELANCLVITSDSGETYKVTEKICQCKSFFYDRPCAHRACARLVNLYNEAETATPVVSIPAPKIIRSIERDPRTGVKVVAVRCDNWLI